MGELPAVLPGIKKDQLDICPLNSKNIYIYIYLDDKMSVPAKIFYHMYLKFQSFWPL
jgi:hypothetical protein